MTATRIATVPSTRPTPVPTLGRTGLGAGLAAAAATIAVAALARTIGVSLETAPGEAIPVAGFGQLTLFCTALGVLMARTIGRRARRPRPTFTTATMVLTALSLVPDVMLSTDVATKATLVLTHLVAAAIVIPALAARLPEHTPS